MTRPSLDDLLRYAKEQLRLQCYRRHHEREYHCAQGIIAALEELRERRVHAAHTVAALFNRERGT